MIVLSNSTLASRRCHRKRESIEMNLWGFVAMVSSIASRAQRTLSTHKKIQLCNSLFRSHCGKTSATPISHFLAPASPPLCIVSIDMYSPSHRVSCNDVTLHRDLHAHKALRPQRILTFRSVVAWTHHDY